jgi:hypothetical protein
MTRPLLLSAVVLTLVGSGQTLLPERVPTDELIRRLKAEPADLTPASELAGRTGPDVIPALEEAFLAATRSGASNQAGLRWSQIIAMALMEMGVKDQIYFDELAKYGRAVISANPPPQLVWDPDAAAEGARPGSGPGGWRRSPEYDSWCQKRRLQGDACTQAITSFSSDIAMLAGSRDAQAVAILREILDLSNPTLVVVAVLKLGMLGDSAALPAIAAACARFSPREALLIGSAASTFESPAMRPALDKCVSDQGIKRALISDWQEKHDKSKGDLR